MSADGGAGVKVTATALSFSLFGSGVVADDTVAKFVKSVPGGVAGSMWKTNVKSALKPAASSAPVHDTLPVPPAGGVKQRNAGPLFCMVETKVIPGGMLSVSVTSAESSGPVLVTLTSYETSESAGA